MQSPHGISPPQEVLPASAIRMRQAFDIDPALAAQWDVLAENQNASPSQRRLWLEPWWEAFGAGQIEIHAVHRDGELTGILPMTRRGMDLESTANLHTPSSEILAKDEPSAVGVARRLFRGAPTRVSFTILDQAGWTLDACRQAALENDYAVRVSSHGLSPRLQLRDGPNPIKRAIDSRLRLKIRRAHRELGPISLQTITGGEHLDAWLADFFRVEVSGWKGLTGTAAASRPDTRHFYSALAHRAAHAGMLRLFLLKSGKRTVAGCFALQSHDTCWLLRSGYDHEFAAQSPRTLLLHELIHQSLALGTTRIEFNGGMEPYKLQWSNCAVHHMRFDAFAPTLAGRLARASSSLRPMASRVRTALGLAESGYRQ